MKQGKNQCSSPVHEKRSPKGPYVVTSSGTATWSPPFWSLTDQPSIVASVSIFATAEAVKPIVAGTLLAPEGTAGAASEGGDPTQAAGKAQGIKSTPADEEEGPLPRRAGLL